MKMKIASMNLIDEANGMPTVDDLRMIARAEMDAKTAADKASLPFWTNSRQRRRLRKRLEKANTQSTPT